MDRKSIGSITKKWMATFAFLLAVGLVSLFCVWAIQRYGATQGGTVNPLSLQKQPSAAAVESPSAATMETPSAPVESAPEPPAATGSASLDVPLVSQHPELINGCEATSLCIVLRYYGFDADKSTLAYDYIPREDFSSTGGLRYGPHPETAYPGDPATTKGFYCFPGPIVAGANSYLAEQQSALQAYDLTGASGQELERQLADGHPVMVWLTLDYGAQLTYCSFTWHLADGTTYIPYCNLHCVVLAGFDEDGFQVCDPINGTLTVSRDDLLASYQALGSMAAVIK